MGNGMSRIQNNSRCESAFICSSCGRTVLSAGYGTRQRNHCPYCLWSSHVDITTGDRRSLCRGRMVPLSVCAAESGEWSIVHRCEKCGFMRLNRIAGDDDARELLLLAIRPVMNSPFPDHSLAEMIRRGGLYE